MRIAFVTLALALGVAIAVRLCNLDAQVLGGDEMHAVNTALTTPLGEVLTTYRENDNSIPLTAFFRRWIERGGTLDERLLRAPALVTSIATVAAFAAAVWRPLGPGVAARFAWLLALSPALVLYGRMVRSYAPMAFLGGAAAIAGFHWIETRRSTAAVAYALLGAAAIWFHLLAAPFVAAPLAFAAGDLAVAKLRGRPAPGPRLLELLATASLFALACACFLVPAWDSLAARVQTTSRLAHMSLDTWAAVAQLQAGSSSGVVALAFFALAAWGLAALARERPRLAAYTAVLVALHVGGLLAIRPARFEVPLVWNRYLLPCLPVLLLWVAVGLGRLGRAAWRARVAPLATALLLGVGVLAGPLGEPAFRTNAFVHANDFLGFDRPRPRLAPADVPEFYRALPPDADLIEIPAPWIWDVWHAIPLYQDAHGGRVRVVDPGLTRFRAAALRNTLPAEPTALARSGADWVVVHLHLMQEESRVRASTREPRSVLPTPEATGSSFDLAAASVERALRTAWGAPDYADPLLVAWKLPR